MECNMETDETMDEQDYIAHIEALEDKNVYLETLLKKLLDRFPSPGNMADGAQDLIDLIKECRRAVADI